MLFIFFATIVCYNFVKYGVEAKKYLMVSKPSHRPIQLFSFLAFAACIHFFLQLPHLLWWAIGVLTIISLLYAVPLLPSSRNLRSLGGLKIVVVAAVWVGFVVMLPALDNQLGLSRQVALLSLQNFILVLILILPFEIRDLPYDTPQLRTIPQRFGFKRTKMIGFCLILAYLFIGCLRTCFSLSLVLPDLFLSLVLLLMLERTKQQQSTYFASFWVEGIPILWCLFVRSTF